MVCFTTCMYMWHTCICTSCKKVGFTLIEWCEVGSPLDVSVSSFYWNTFKGFCMNRALGRVSTGGKKLKAKTLPVLLNPSYSHFKGQCCRCRCCTCSLNTEYWSTCGWHPCYLYYLYCTFQPSKPVSHTSWHIETDNRSHSHSRLEIAHSLERQICQKTSEDWNVIMFVPLLMSISLSGKFITFRIYNWWHVGLFTASLFVS